MKKHQNIILLFVVLSVINILAIVLISHYCNGKNGASPLSWEEISDDITVIIIFSLLSALVATLVVAYQARHNK